MAGPLISEASALGRELWKWDHTTREVHPADDNDLVPEHLKLRGVRPAIPLEYPKLLYKAKKKANGVVSVGEVTPNAMDFERMDQYERATLYVESFNRGCQKLVKSEDEERAAKRDGWCVTQTEALDRAEGLEVDIARAAAEAIAATKRMSPKAQEEFAMAEAATSDHVTDVTPKRKGDRG